MGDIADMMIEGFIDDMLFIEDELFNFPRIVTREERKRAWEDSIIKNEEYGVWQMGGKSPQKIKFSDMKPSHIKNVYEMLKRNDMYIPAFIKMTVEHHNEGFLDKLTSAKRLVGRTVLVLEKETTCNNCPLAYYNAQEYDEDFGRSGDSHYHCSITDEDVNYQHKYKKRGVTCPLKEVI